VLLSLAGFVLRFFWTIRGSSLATRRLTRIAPHVIDTLLLAAALGMLAVSATDPLDHPWLLTKIAGLMVYIVFGMFALRRAKSRAGRYSAFAAALAVFAFIASVALTKSAWGLLTRLA
jgi:uncharacterized membrane protein SirB2